MFQPNKLRKYPQNLITKTHCSVNKRPPRSGSTVAKIMSNNSLHSHSPNLGQCAVSTRKPSLKCPCLLQVSRTVQTEKSNMNLGRDIS